MSKEDRRALLALLPSMPLPTRRLLRQLVALGVEWGYGLEDRWSEAEHGLFKAVTGSPASEPSSNWKEPVL